MITIDCQVCHKSLDIYPSWLGRRKTCSKDCAKKLGNNTGVMNPMYGKKHTQDTKLKMVRAKLGIRGETANRWLGDKAGYSAVHMWIRKMLGEPGTCDICGTCGLHGRKIHWANISGEYHRDLKDWTRLCAICHKEYDRNRVTAKWIFNLKVGGYAGRRVSLEI